MVTLPEDQGGLGLPREAAVAVHFELGRVVSTAPLMPALLALEGIAAAEGLADRAGWIERICGGEYVPLNMLPGTVETWRAARSTGGCPASSRRTWPPTCSPAFPAAMC